MLIIIDTLSSWNYWS